MLLILGLKSANYIYCHQMSTCMFGSLEPYIYTATEKKLRRGWLRTVVVTKSDQDWNKLSG